MSRTNRVRVPAARHFKPGTLRADAPDSILRCLVLAPGPDWVAVDLESGALVRARAVDAYPEQEEAAELRIGRALSAVELTLALDNEPPDPGRPEAVALAKQPERLSAARRRAVKRLLGHVTTTYTGQLLLGTLAPSVSYTDLDGTRSSVVVVAPDSRPRFGVAADGSWCQFTLGGRRHRLAFLGRAGAGAGPGTDIPKLLVVGFGSPHKGQLPKVVLGALPKI